MTATHDPQPYATLTPNAYQILLALTLLCPLAHQASAQFEITSPIVLPAERALDPTGVVSAERMEMQLRQQEERARQMRQNQNQMQRQSQPAGLPTPPIRSNTPAPGNGWIELNTPTTITNSGIQSGTQSFVQPGPQTFEDGITFSDDDGSGYVYSDGYEEGFWGDLDCDCRKCRRQHLFGKCWECCKPDIGGWLAAGFYDNAHGGDGSFGQTPLGFNNIEGPQFNQGWLYLDKSVERGGGWDFGYRLDFLFGADGPDTQAFGDESFDFDWNTSGQYGFALPQLYVEAAYGNTSVKAGRFYTIIGYEVVQAPDNFFYSHAYTFYYNEPFTHTGILAQHDFSDAWTFYAGYTFGWDSGFSNGNDGATFLGGVTWSPSEYFSVTYATSIGDPGDDPIGSSDTYLQSIVFDTQLTDNLEWVLQSDFQNRQSAVSDGRSFGLVNYLFYTWDDYTSFGFRYEWFRDGRGLAGLAGASENFHAFTLGLNRRITDRFMVRPEVRFDFADRDAGFAGEAFDRGTENTQFTFGSQAIWTF